MLMNYNINERTILIPLKRPYLTKTLRLISYSIPRQTHLNAARWTCTWTKRAIMRSWQLQLQLTVADASALKILGISQQAKGAELEDDSRRGNRGLCGVERDRSATLSVSSFCIHRRWGKRAECFILAIKAGITWSGKTFWLAASSRSGEMTPQEDK